MNEHEFGAVTLTFDLDAMRERNTAAHQMVSDLCHRRREWFMSIPARCDYDPDLVIDASLRDVPKLILAYEAVKSERSDLLQSLTEMVELFIVPNPSANRDVQGIYERAVAAIERATFTNKEGT